MTIPGNQIVNFFNGCVTLDGHHLRPGNHDFPDDRISEFQDALDHFPGLRIDEAVFLSGINDGLNFLFQMGRILGRENPLELRCNGFL
jgi:hypothetical protein